MLELKADNVIDYLRERNWIAPGPAHAEALGWGVSNVVLRITTPERKFVLKQSRAQLRTRDPWFSDLQRIWREREVMEMLGSILPEGTVPRVLFDDRDNYAFAMTHAPDDAVVWKEQLLAGKTDAAVARRAGLILGRIHETTAKHPELVEPFRDHSVFVQLRAEPFYERLKSRHPELAHDIQATLDDVLARKEALCHGDYTPKNFLVHSDGFTLVDHETACYGDPSMDVGLFLAHMILKALHLPERHEDYLELTREFWQGYREEITALSLSELETRGIRHYAICALTRIDGTSPVDYLPREDKRQVVRRLSQSTLRDRVAKWSDVLDLCRAEMTKLHAE